MMTHIKLICVPRFRGGRYHSSGGLQQGTHLHGSTPQGSVEAASGLIPIDILVLNQTHMTTPEKGPEYIRRFYPMPKSCNDEAIPCYQ